MPGAAGFEVRATRRAGMVLGDRYEIRGFLARGATSKVYLGHDLQNDIPVAIKILRSVIDRKPGLREHFEREACIGLEVAHESIVRTFAAETPADGPCYIVMEPLLGESLGEILRAGTTWSFDLRLQVAHWAARAVEAIHGHGFVHRDVKPDNFHILGSREAPTGLKLLDLGMATDGLDEHLADGGQVLGTAEYMSPEQILAEPADVRSDVYSFGVFLFRLFTEHLPFEGNHIVETLRLQLFSPAPPPTWMSEQLDARIDGIILTALQKHRENRYPSMSAVIEDLTRLSEPAGKPRLSPRVHEPDTYVPLTPRGLQALHAMAIPFGEYARLASPLPPLARDHD